MDVTFYLAMLCLASLSKGNEIGSRREADIENDAKDDKDEDIGFESFASPVYGLNNNPKSSGLNGKSAYTPPTPALPPNYAAYLASLGLGNPYSYGPYNRYGISPYAYPSLFGYGSPLLNNPLLSSALLSGLGYAGYGNPYLGRSIYPGLGYGYLPYSSGFGGLGYAPAGLRGPPAPTARVPAPGPGIPSPAARVSAPFAALPPPVPSVPNGIPPPVPAGVPYGAPYRGKDGSIRYGYGPADVQPLPAY